MTKNFGRALRTKIAFQTGATPALAFATHAPGPWFGVTTIRRGDPASPDLVDDPLLGLATDNPRDPTAPQLGMQKGDTQRTVPLALDEAGFWLAACFGFPVSTGSVGAYTHTFKSGADALPALTVQDLLRSGDFRRQRGAVVDGFQLRAVKENAYPQMVLDMLMRDVEPAAAWLAGDDAPALAIQRPPAFAAEVLWNDAPMGESLNVALTYKNNCERAPNLNGSEFPIGIDVGLSAVGGSFDARFLSDTFHALARAGGAPGKLSLVWKLPSAPTTRSIQFNWNMVRLSTSGQPVEGAGEITSSFTVRGEQGASGTPAVTVTLKNGVETYVPAEDEE